MNYIALSDGMQIKVIDGIKNAVVRRCLAKALSLNKGKLCFPITENWELDKVIEIALKLKEQDILRQVEEKIDVRIAYLERQVKCEEPYTDDCIYELEELKQSLKEIK